MLLLLLLLSCGARTSPELESLAAAATTASTKERIEHLKGIPLQF
jgi:hypothetical protein